jgi:uncharacterized protein (TIGR03435 family)
MQILGQTMRASMVFIVVAAVSNGQQTPRLTFEVASVKPSQGRANPNGWKTTGMAPRITGDPEQINFTDVSLLGLLSRAYDVMPLDVRAPDWMSVERYDVLAKVPSDVPKGHIPEMLQNLLADRFRIKLHRDAKLESGYALVRGKGELKLKAAAPDANRSMGMSSKGHLTWTSSTLADLASSLTQFIGQPVVDMTGIPEKFDIALDAAPDSMPGFHGAPDHESLFPTIFVALRDLGLNLQPQKVSVKYLVIDSALRVPTEN